MTRATIVDTGPIVALLSHSDRWHRWAKEQFGALRAPLFTCEAAMSESSFLLRDDGQAIDALFGLLERRVLEIGFGLGAEHLAVRALMRRYANVPMSLADACLVRMSELLGDTQVLTLNGDFGVYRRLGRQTIPVVSPRLR